MLWVWFSICYDSLHHCCSIYSRFMLQLSWAGMRIPKVLSVLLNVLSVSAFTHVCLVHILWFGGLRCFSVISHRAVSLFICPWRTICGNGIGELSALMCSCLHPLGKVSSRSSKAQLRVEFISEVNIFTKSRLHTLGFYTHFGGGQETSRVCWLQNHFCLRAQFKTMMYLFLGRISRWHVCFLWTSLQ